MQEVSVFKCTLLQRLWYLEIIEIQVRQAPANGDSYLKRDKNLCKIHKTEIQ